MLTSIFPKYEGDTNGIFVYNNAVALSEAGVEVHVVAPSAEDTKEFEIINGIFIYRYRYWFTKKHQRVAYGLGIHENLHKSMLAKIQLPLFLISYLWKGLIVAKKCNIIHAQWIQSAYPGLLAKLFYKIPVMISVRGSDIRFFAKGPVMRRVTKFILDKGDKIFSQGPGETKLIQELGNYNIISIHNPLEREMFNPDIPTEKLIKEFNLMDELIVSFIARLEEKDVDFFTYIEAIPSVIKRITNVRFFIIGDGPLKTDVENMIEEKNLNEFVIITGNRNDVNAFHAATDIFVNLRKFENLWNNTLIEALASGCACIVSDVGEISNHLNHLENIFLVPPNNPEKLADAMLLLLKNKNLRRTLGKNARSYIAQNQFYKNEVVEKLMTIYCNAMTN